MPEPPRDLVRVALANDFVVVVAGLAALLAPHGDRVEVVDIVLVGRDESSPPVDVVLFDTFGRPDLGVAEVARLVADPAFRHVVVYTTDTSPSAVSRLLAAGASGFFSKDLPSAALVDGLERVARGDQVLLLAPHRRARSASEWPGRLSGLTERESEVLALLARGYRNHEIADALFVSLDTVKTHVKAVYRKLGVRNRASAVAAALADGSFSTRGQVP